MEPTDEQLAEQSALGDDDAFQEIVRRHLTSVYRFAFHYARTEEDADDITQDSFFKAWKHIKRYKKGRAFKPLLFTIARNTALDFIKKKKPHVFSSLDNDNDSSAFEDTLEDSEPLQPELFERAETKEVLKKLMDELHPDHRSVLTLYYEEELTFEEIAETLGKPMNTVKSWHRRALIRIRNLLHQKRR
ncbi:MAG: RNA polymerase sigma factor [Candidatus Pacebacteria bacterium]|nr:RNA polymerase sigma factor [Candidatus Paceibacterota bacterium]